MCLTLSLSHDDDDGELVQVVVMEVVEVMVMVVAMEGIAMLVMAVVMVGMVMVALG